MNHYTINYKLKRGDTKVVKRNIGHTTLRKIVVVYRGMDMVVCEEIV
jgi:hypothetical protein